MSKEIINTIILATAFLLLFAVAEIFYHKLKVKVELTRKLVHFGTGIITMLFPIMIGNHWFVLFLCGSFALILLISLKFNLLQSVNAIERKSYGSISYPLSVYGCYLAFDIFNHQYIYFYLPILILAFCDPIAALTGKKWPLGKYKIRNDSKTLMGSGMFFISAFALSLIFYFAFYNIDYVYAFLACSALIALTATIAEATSSKGFDNLTIPLFTFLIIAVLHHYLFKELFQWII